MRNVLGLLFRRRAYRVGEGMRGRVHKISIIAGGEVSIVIRCGMDEPRARQLLQGGLVEFFETREGIPPAPTHEMTIGTPPEGGSEGTVEFVELGKVSDTGKPTQQTSEDTQ